MSESTPNSNLGRPAPGKTIRIGTEMFDDVQDYLVLIRTSDNDDEDVIVRASSKCWAHGVMLQEAAFIQHSNEHLDCGGGPDDELEDGKGDD